MTYVQLAEGSYFCFVRSAPQGRQEISVASFLPPLRGSWLGWGGGSRASRPGLIPIAPAGLKIVLWVI